MIQNEGMPIHKRPFDKGNLYIHFNVEFPKSGFFQPKALQELEKILPPRRPAPKITEEVEEVSLTKVNPSEQRSGGGRGRRTMDEDEDEEEGGQRGGVQCAQQ